MLLLVKIVNILLNKKKSCFIIVLYKKYIIHKLETFHNFVRLLLFSMHNGIVMLFKINIKILNDN